MPDPIENLYRLQKKDLSRACVVLADAFKDDPIWNAVFRDVKDKRKVFKTFFQFPLKYCMRYGHLYATSENLEGIAAWTQGSLASMSPLRILLSGTFSAIMKINFKIWMNMMAVFRGMENDRKTHLNGKPFLYLMIVGVASEYRGEGHGGKLIRSLIEKSKQQGVSIYLETETENNVAMYKKYGFRVIKKITLPRIDVPLWEMIRE